jgi:hypothetical protein
VKVLNSSEVAQVSGGLDQRQFTQIITMGAIAVTNFALRKNKTSVNPDSALGFFMGPASQILATAISNELCNIWFAFHKASKTPSYNTPSE